ncbi:hypothetical protein BC835DRAFT_698469 [Cytidiella melzeri]|nr:hypothetical protein BC835DRAFT_698469 [Cytidiella melzeri]
MYLQLRNSVRARKLPSYSKILLSVLRSLIQQYLCLLCHLLFRLLHQALQLLHCELCRECTNVYWTSIWTIASEVTRLVAFEAEATATSDIDVHWLSLATKDKARSVLACGRSRGGRKGKGTRGVGLVRLRGGRGAAWRSGRSLKEETAWFSAESARRFLGVALLSLEVYLSRTVLPFLESPWHWTQVEDCLAKGCIEAIFEEQEFEF